MEPLLSIKNLSVRFNTESRETIAVKDLSISINPGEIHAVVGESGSGKSVTALSILRLLNKNQVSSSGEILFQQNGGLKNILDLAEAQVREIRGKEISMIFQEPMTSLNPVIRCGEQVSEAIRLHLKLSKAAAKTRTIELFQKLHLPRPEEMYRSYPHQISGGQKQRIMIAMAISCKPRLLIADEPTTALDVTVQKSILETLAELQKNDSLGILFITHDLAVVSQFADRVSVMYQGELMESGAVSDIFLNPQSAYTKALLACRPKPGTRLSRLPVVSDFISTDEGKIIESNDYIEAEPENEVYRKTRHQTLYNQKPLLELKSVSNKFFSNKSMFKKSTFTAVDDVSLDVFKGESLGLVGESGCGKTTLGKMILNLLNPSSGSVFYKGDNIHHLQGAQLRNFRKSVQVIFQDPFSSLNPKMRIGDAIMEPMRVHGIYKTRKECIDRAKDLLVKVGLRPEHYDRYPMEFSGGQRQRIIIARALSINPEFIVCDECVSALDVSVQAQILNLLNELKAEHDLTFIFISHDLNVVRYFCDRVAIMNNGAIEQIGESDEVCANPGTAYAKKLLDAIPKLSPYS